MSEDAKPLNAEYQEWMDNATEGVIVASFGSIVHPSEEDNRLLLQTFAKLPYRVLWKLRNDHRIGIDTIPSNVRIEEWIPQVIFYIVCNNLFRMTCLVILTLKCL
jgi:UDP:flavonoid glycosyltransferase YjiC (YdhE family)